VCPVKDSRENATRDDDAKNEKKRDPAELTTTLPTHTTVGYNLFLIFTINLE
jgi:hypothetical protein